MEDDAAARQPSFGAFNPVPASVQSVPAAAPANAPAAAETAGEDKLCRSPVTGVVIKVNVAPGQTVAANDLLLVLEAMKMETNVTAHSAGKVKSVRVGIGDPVKVNSVVVEFE